LARKTWWFGYFTIERLKELEGENRRPKKMYAEDRLIAEIVRVAIDESGEAISAKNDSAASLSALRR